MKEVKVLDWEITERNYEETVDRPIRSENDKIHHPKHYTQGIECWDYIVSHEMGYLEGNIIKYITRYKDKDGLNDLLKARAYLDRLIKKAQGAPR